VRADGSLYFQDAVSSPKISLKRGDSNLSLHSGQNALGSFDAASGRKDAHEKFE